MLRRNHWLRLVAVGVCLLGLSACAELQLPTPAPLDTATALPSATPTIVWFPATSTPTPDLRPTRTPQPTPDMKPGVGQVILSDNFSTPSQWQLVSNSSGSAAFGVNELTVAIAQPKTGLTSLRKGPQLTDFYLEMTATLSLCRGVDTYGVLVRAADSQNGYRLAISCEGLLRLERLKSGQVALLTPWQASGQVAPGSPQVLRLGIWAVRNELRVFVNGVYQFSARDPVWNTGTVGVFARSAGETAVSISFSDLEVRKVELGGLTLSAATPSRTP